MTSRPLRHYYQDLDRGSFDYDLQTLPGFAGETFRGPAIDPSKPYIAVLGAAQTFGRFSARPFPTLLADRLGIQTLNLGVGGAGPQLFDTPAYLELANRAELVVVQILSSRSVGNSLFDNSKSGSLRGVRIEDGKAMRFEEFLDNLVKSEPLERVKQAVRETRENYVRQTTNLLQNIRRPKVLLWFSGRSPEYAVDYASTWGILNTAPHLVDRAMVDEIKPHAEAYVEYHSKRGLPQTLWHAEQAIDGTTVEQGLLMNYYYPSPEMHAEATQALIPACELLLPNRVRSRVFELGDGFLTSRRFVIVSAERSGSTLLSGLLDSHPECLVSGECFNQRLIEQDKLIGIPQAFGHDTLNALRKSDPVAFTRRFFELAAAQGYRASGFKLMYGHGDRYAAVRNTLVAETSIDIIHVRRRNLLRRFLSEQRAFATSTWGRRAGDERVPLPQLRLDVVPTIRDFAHIEAKQAEYVGLFRDHRVLDVFYEDLEEDPQREGARAVAFLGLSSGHALEVRYAKTGTDSLPTAITNYKELRATFERWLSFFED